MPNESSAPVRDERADDRARQDLGLARLDAARSGGQTDVYAVPPDLAARYQQAVNTSKPERVSGLDREEVTVSTKLMSTKLIPLGGGAFALWYGLAGDGSGDDIVKWFCVVVAVIAGLAAMVVKPAPDTAQPARAAARPQSKQRSSRRSNSRGRR